MRKQIHGILLLDKPANMTSNGALQRVKRLFNAKKAGHTGSLDPIATGMLPICFGDATKFSQFLLESNKTYQVAAKLGLQTATGDSEGEIINSKAVPEIAKEKMQAVLAKYLGESSQIPPMFSAIKHQGQPLYQLARKGISVERKPRSIKIFSIELLNLTDDTFSFTVHCSKGTYIRTLVEDIAKDLDNYAHVIELRRILVSPYTDSRMYTLDQIESFANDAESKNMLESLLPVETAVQTYPSIKLSTAAAFYLRMGQAVRIPHTVSNSLVRLSSENGEFLGVGECLPDGRIKPHRLVSGG